MDIRERMAGESERITQGVLPFAPFGAVFQLFKFAPGEFVLRASCPPPLRGRYATPFVPDKRLEPLIGSNPLTIEPRWLAGRSRGFLVRGVCEVGRSERMISYIHVLHPSGQPAADPDCSWQSGRT